MADTAKSSIFEQIELAKTAVAGWDAWRRESAHFGTAVGQSLPTRDSNKSADSEAVTSPSNTKAKID
jgi:hypothetical protein